MRTDHIVGWCDDCHKRTCPQCDNCDCDGYPCEHQIVKMGANLTNEYEEKQRQDRLRREMEGMQNQYAKQAMPLGYEGKSLYISSIRRELEMKKSKLSMELELIDSALKDCSPEAETLLRLVSTLDKLGMRTRL